MDEIDLNDCTPSHDQAIRMRKFFEEGKLTTEAISAIMSEEKPNQREKIVLRGDRVRSLIPKNIPINQTEEYVCKALEQMKLERFPNLWQENKFVFNVLFGLID